MYLIIIISSNIYVVYKEDIFRHIANIFRNSFTENEYPSIYIYLREYLLSFYHFLR